MRKQTIIALISMITLAIAASAQTTNIWKGGFPGQETNWNQNQNWSLGKTPDAFDRVIIPDVTTSTLKYPIIQKGMIEVGSLEIQQGASLTMLRPARIMTSDFVCNGTCKGCEWRVSVEGSERAETALKH